MVSLNLSVSIIQRTNMKIANITLKMGKGITKRSLHRTLPKSVSSIHVVQCPYYVIQLLPQ